MPYKDLGLRRAYARAYYLKHHKPRTTCRNGHGGERSAFDSRGHRVCLDCADARKDRYSYKNYEVARRAQAKYQQSEKYRANRLRYYERLQLDPDRLARLREKKAAAMKEKAGSAQEKKRKAAYMRRWFRSPEGVLFRKRHSYRLPSGVEPEIVQLFVKFNQLKKELRK